MVSVSWEKSQLGQQPAFRPPFEGALSFIQKRKDLHSLALAQGSPGLLTHGDYLSTATERDTEGLLGPSLPARATARRKLFCLFHGKLAALRCKSDQNGGATVLLR